MWEVYIVETDSGSLYTGITTDLDRRLKEHQGEKPGGARFFRTSNFKAVVFREHHPDRASASRREAAIKKMHRHQKLRLIQESQRAL